MSDPEPPERPTREEIKERTATLARRVGYVLFMGGGLLIFIPMLIGVGSGIKNDRVWDPFTESRVGVESTGIDCEEEARRLLVEAGRHGRLEASWDEPFRAWRTRCRKSYPQLFDMLRQTRLELHEGSESAP